MHVLILILEFQRYVCWIFAVISCGGISNPIHCYHYFNSNFEPDRYAFQLNRIGL